jgi:hypothetical protein
MDRAAQKLHMVKYWCDQRVLIGLSFGKKLKSAVATLLPEIV